GTYFYVVAATNSAGTSANSNEASATVATAAAATLAPASLPFGNVTQGTTSAFQTVTVTSTGTSALILAASNAITISGPHAADFAVAGGGTCANGSNLGTSGSCTIRITFSPSTALTETASLVVVSNDPSSPDTVSLSGTGVAATTVSCGAVSPCSSLNFGNINPHKSSSSQTVTLTNNTNLAITITSVAITGGDSSPFSISSNNCGASLAGLASCNVVVVFAPTTTGNKSSTLVFTHSAPTSPQSVTLTGSAKKRGVLRVGAAVNWPGGGELRKTIL